MASGTLFAFNCYSDVLSERLSLTSTELNVAVNMGFVGQYILSLIPGMISDRLGIRYAYLYGVIAMICGYGGLFAQVKSLFSKSAYLVYLWYLLVGIGGGGYYITTMNNVPKNFLPKARPLYFGFLVTCFGICGAIFTAIYKAYFKENRDVVGMILVLFISTSVIGLGTLFTQRKLPPSKDDTKTSNYFGCGAVMKGDNCVGRRRARRQRRNGSYVFIDDAPNPIDDEDDDMLHDGAERKEDQNLLEATGNISVVSYTTTVEDVDEGSDEDGDDDSEDFHSEMSKQRLAAVTVPDERDVTGLALLREPRYVLLIIGSGMVIGSAMDYMNNTKLILTSNHYNEDTTLLFVALSSYSNAGGRFVFAIIAFLTLLSVNKCMLLFFSHTFFLLLGSIFSLIASTLTVIGQGTFTLVAACIHPISYGCIFSVIPDYIQKKWGAKSFAFNLAFIPVATSSV